MGGDMNNIINTSTTAINIFQNVTFSTEEDQV